MRTASAARLGWGWGLLLCSVLAGCSGEDTPCGPCAQVAGRWLLDVDAPVATCPGALPPPGSLELTQVAATLSATLDGGTLSGTLYDSRRFSLHGSAASGTGERDLLSVRAYYAPGLSDGGLDRLYDGSWTWTSAATGCAEVRRFTAQRQ